MSKLYVPNYIDIENVSCVNLANDNTIYISYSNGTNLELTYNNLLSDYTTKTLENLDVSCHAVELTHEIFYRKDFTNALITFMLLAIIWFYLPYKIFTRAFGRWLKV